MEFLFSRVFPIILYTLFFCTFNSSCLVKCERNIPSYRARPGTITPHIRVHNTGRQPERHDRYPHSAVTTHSRSRLPSRVKKKKNEITKSEKNSVRILLSIVSQVENRSKYYFHRCKKKKRNISKVAFDGYLMLFKIKNVKHRNNLIVTQNTYECVYFQSNIHMTIIAICFVRLSSHCVLRLFIANIIRVINF